METNRWGLVLGEVPEDLSSEGHLQMGTSKTGGTVRQKGQALAREAKGLGVGRERVGESEE